ncbi:unnamed protein product, partial [Polarella glacialis]
MAPPPTVSQAICFDDDLDGGSSVAEVSSEEEEEDLEASKAAARTTYKRRQLTFKRVVCEVPYIVEGFWLRRLARRRILKHIAEECAQFAPVLRRRSAELR